MVLSILSTQVLGQVQTHQLLAPSAQYCHCTYLAVTPFRSSEFLKTPILKVGYALKTPMVAKQS